LGLVWLSRALGDPEAAREALGPFSSALAVFRSAGHLQGISYALSNLGVAEALTGREELADARFNETIRIAERLGERWTGYGAREAVEVARRWAAAVADVAADGAVRMNDETPTFEALTPDALDRDEQFWEIYGYSFPPEEREPPSVIRASIEAGGVVVRAVVG